MLKRYINTIKKKPVLLVFVATVLLSVILCSWLLIANNRSKDNAVIYGNGRGGDTNLLIDYHDKAVKAWNLGNKRDAKDLAKKAQSEAQKLNSSQQSNMPNQMQILLDVNDIINGSYIGSSQ